jgi:hypothetical protein
MELKTTKINDKHDVMKAFNLIKDEMELNEISPKDAMMACIMFISGISVILKIPEKLIINDIIKQMKIYKDTNEKKELLEELEREMVTR